MSYEFAFDSENQILRVRFQGQVTDEELKEFYSRAAEEVGRTNPRAAIIDLTAVNSFAVSPETLRDLARTAPAMPDPLRPRVIVAPPAHLFGMARMFQLQGEKTRPSLRVVTNLQEAFTFLGVPETPFEPIPAA